MLPPFVNRLRYPGNLVSSGRRYNAQSHWSRNGIQCGRKKRAIRCSYLVVFNALRQDQPPCRSATERKIRSEQVVIGRCHGDDRQGRARQAPSSQAWALAPPAGCRPGSWSWSALESHRLADHCQRAPLAAGKHAWSNWRPKSALVGEISRPRRGPTAGSVGWWIGDHMAMGIWAGGAPSGDRPGDVAMSARGSGPVGDGRGRPRNQFVARVAESSHRLIRLGAVLSGPG